MEKEKRVITISRQYAAYGRTVAAGLAERLQLKWYDKDFVEKTVKESGYAKEDIERQGEQMSRASELLNSFLNGAAPYPSSYDGIFKAQKDVILNLAKEDKSCIIIGRCANDILQKENIPSFNIFLYASDDFRLERAAELNPDLSKSDLVRYVEKREKLRENYYKHYTGNAMGDSRNYDICIDVGTVGVDKTLDILTDILQ